MKRQTFTLDRHEIDAFNRLPLRDGDAFTFWRSVAVARNLDYKTILNGLIPYEFSALPLGHGKPWCWPMPLKMSKRAVYADAR